MRALISVTLAFGAAVLPISLDAAPASSNELVLHCVGYSVQLGGVIDQYIEIDGDFARVKGLKYWVEKRPSSYDLYGPIDPWQPNTGKVSPEIFSISRATGEYMVYPGNLAVGGSPSEFSTESQPGCRPVQF